MLILHYSNLISANKTLVMICLKRLKYNCRRFVVYNMHRCPFCLCKYSFHREMDLYSCKYIFCVPVCCGKYIPVGDTSHDNRNGYDDGGGASLPRNKGDNHTKVNTKYNSYTDLNNNLHILIFCKVGMNTNRNNHSTTEPIPEHTSQYCC